MELKLYDTLTKEKRPFGRSIRSASACMCAGRRSTTSPISAMRGRSSCSTCCSGCCGHLYGADHVTYVRNITDVDDKINDRAARDYPDLPLNEAIRKVTEEDRKAVSRRRRALGCLRPTVEPRATEHIAEMRAIIEKLIAGGNAYVEQDHVLFEVGIDAGLRQAGAALARRDAGRRARVDVAPTSATMRWTSCCGSRRSRRAGMAVAGRHHSAGAPGLAHRMLGDGVEASRRAVRHSRRRHRSRVPASRERDRAIALRFHKDRMANVWMHNGFLQVEGEKMSKSLGNFVTIRELLTDWR
jgi:cysteinyl-tRNA synthetase